MLFMNDPFRGFESLLTRFPRGDSSPMAMDAYRRDGDVWVHIDLPGVTGESVEINVERNVLTVSAERSWQREDGDQVYLAERGRGRFERQVHLGESLDADGIEADLSDGVLTLRIPIAEQAQPRKIAVNTQKAIESASA